MEEQNEETGELVFTITDEEGNSVECEAICLFHSEDTDKDYIIYTDNDVSEEGELHVMASIFDADALDSDDPRLVLFDIEDPEEWDIVASVLSDITGDDTPVVMEEEYVEIEDEGDLEEPYAPLEGTE